MFTLRIPALVVVAGLAAFSAAPTSAAESPQLACLSKEAQREALAAGKAVPLAQAIRTIRPKAKSEVVRARLCRSPSGLVYLLTLLSRSGKVTSATVDAANGNVIGGG